MAVGSISSRSSRLTITLRSHFDPRLRLVLATQLRRSGNVTERTMLSVLKHPYEAFEPLTRGRAQLKEAARLPGSALVWQMAVDRYRGLRQIVESRPGGLSLIAILPHPTAMEADPDLVRTIQRCRPHGLLPRHEEPHPSDIAAVLRRPPLDLAAEVTDYLAWRGIVVDRDTTQLVRRIVELSADLRTVTALARGMYVSRRALGRRLMTRGLPVPSHWLQVARILRAAARLQNSELSIFSLAYQSGYPDGFSMSNQMHRLVGYRPTQMREYLGWEWIFEAWLRREAEEGGLAPSSVRKLMRGPKASSPPPPSFPPAKPGRPRRGRGVA